MPKFVAKAIAAGILGVSLLGPAQAINRPGPPGNQEFQLRGLVKLAQAWVPVECRELRDRAAFDQCVENARKPMGEE